MGEMERMAEAFAKSGMFGAKSKEQALALLLLAHGEGLHPAIAMRDFDVIQGRPAKKAEAMLRSFIAAGGSVEWHEMTDEKADATFSHPQGGKVRIDWDMVRARKAGVGGKDMYSKYPRQMLANRVISEGCRRVFPASTSGLYVPEEVAGMGREKDITPTAGYLAALPAEQQNVMHETAAEVKALWANNQAEDAYSLIENSKLDAEEMIALWSLLPSDIRSAHKRMKDAEIAQAKGTISPAKHKRLEALIKEHKLDRGALKSWCNEQFQVDSFPKLTDDQYKKLDDYVASLMTNAAPQSSTATGGPAIAGLAAASQDVGQGDIAGAATLSEQHKGEIVALLEMANINVKRLLAASKVKSLDDIPDAHFGKCLSWIDRASKSKQEA